MTNCAFFQDINRLHNSDKQIPSSSKHGRNAQSSADRDVTLTSLPVGAEEESLRAETEHASDIRDTSVGAASIAQGTVAGVLTVESIGHEASPREILAGACKASEGIVARVLTGSVSVAQKTLVDVFDVVRGGGCGDTERRKA